MQLILLQNSSPQGSFMLQNGQTISIGRQNCAINLPDASVSRNHAIISMQEGRIFCIDYSTGGTFKNGTRLSKNQTVPLNNGDILRFSNSRYELRIGNVPTNTPQHQTLNINAKSAGYLTIFLRFADIDG